MKLLGPMLFGALLLLVSTPELRAASTINPDVPAQNSPLNSAVVRNNFTAAYNDVSNILGKFAGTSAPQTPTNLQDWVDTSGGAIYAFKIWNAGTNTWVQWASLNITTGVFTVLPISSAYAATAPLAVNVSGGVVTYSLNTDTNFTVNGGNLALANIASGSLLANCTGGSSEPTGCTWNAYANQAIGSSNGMLPYRTGGSWGTVSTGTSGATLPFLNGANTWSAVQSIYLGASALPSSLTGSVFRLGNADAIITRIEADSFGAQVTYTGARSDGTAASPTALVTNDEIVGLNAWGYNGTALSGGAGTIRIFAGGNWSGTNQPTYLDFATTANGDATRTLTSRMHIENDGGVVVPPTVTGGSQGVGTVNASGLYVSGAAVLTANQTITLSGDVTGSGTTAITTALGNIPTGVTMAGSVLASVIAAPGTPASGKVSIYTDSTDLRLHDKNASGTIGTTVVADTGAANNYISAISAAGVITKSRPACATLSDSSTGCSTTVGTIATQNANAVAITGGTIAGLTGLAVRDTSAAFDVTIAATSSGSLTAGRTLTLNMGNVAHTLAFGTTANTITFPNLASFTVLTSGDTGTVTSTILASSLSLTTPNINVATGTSLALNGCTISANALCTTGSAAISSTLTSAAHTITSASATALAVGLNGSTNPAFQVDASTASQVAGLKVTGAVTGGTVAIVALDSGSNTNVTINAKGTGTIGIGTVSTGVVNIVPNLTLGTAGSVVGVAQFLNATSGSISIQAPTGALGSAVLTLPDVTDTIAGKALANGGTNNSLTASNGGIVYSDASKLNILAGTVTAAQCLLSGSNSAPTWGSCSGAAAVSSVANSDGTLTISPTTGSVTASLALGHANTWTAIQTFTNSDIRLLGSSTGYHTFTSSNAGASNYTVTVPANSLTLAAIDVADQVLTGGANVTSQSLSTGNITVDCGSRPLQYITNGGAYTITAPSSDGSCILLVTNNGSAGATSFSGFTVGANTGDPLTTTNTSKFMISIARINSSSTYAIKALQ